MKGKRSNFVSELRGEEDLFLTYIPFEQSGQAGISGSQNLIVILQPESDPNIVFLVLLQTLNTLHDMTKTEQYNNSLKESLITRTEYIDPQELKTLRYSKPHDTCDNIEIHLGNQAGGFPFHCLGTDWRSVEHLYLCGEFSLEGDLCKTIQEDIRTATSGYAAKRYKKSKHKKHMRSDYNTFRIEWMMWCIWQKCLGSEAFRKHLLSIPADYTIVEVVKNDPIWAAWPNEQGVLVGQNGVGKILTICRKCLLDHTTPTINTELLNEAGIYILGKRVTF